MPLPLTPEEHLPYMVAIFAVTFVLALVLTPLVRRLAIRIGWVDTPGEERRIHKQAVPRLGGLAMFAAFAVGVLLTFVFPVIRQGKVGNELYEVSRVLLLLLGAGIITAVMAVDDIKRLKPLPRLLWQIGVATLVVVPSIIWPGSRNPDDPPGTPGLAPIAMQQGAYVGKRIAQQVEGEVDASPFTYWDKGNLATIGRSFAIADLGWFKFSGLLAWLLWGAVHLVYLTDLWNRVQVFATWVWAYLSFQRTVRVLTPDSFQSDIKLASRATAQSVRVNKIAAPSDGAPHVHTPGS